MLYWDWFVKYHSRYVLSPGILCQQQIMVKNVFDRQFFLYWKWISISIICVLFEIIIHNDDRYIFSSNLITQNVGHLMIHLSIDVLYKQHISEWQSIASKFAPCSNKEIIRSYLDLIDHSMVNLLKVTLWYFIIIVWHLGILAPSCVLISFLLLQITYSWYIPGIYHMNWISNSIPVFCGM